MTHNQVQLHLHSSITAMAQMIRHNKFLLWYMECLEHVPKIHVLLEPQNVALFENRDPANVIC